jgi:peptidoglycan hydrolase-like protein with peptidoglycan-binding domain
MRGRNSLSMMLAILVAAALPAAAQTSQPAHKPATAAATHTATSTHTTTVHSVRARHHAREPRGQMEPAADRITEIQTALARENAYTGDPTGKWDAATIEAMKTFQTAQNLPPTGKIDALTLQRLGLGSDVAGKGAPMPLAAPPASPSAAVQGDNNAAQ